MHRDLKVFKSVALTVSIFLLVAGCGKEQIEQSSVDSSETHLEIAEQEPVAGWLDVVLPSEAVAMDAHGDNIWILTEQGFVMRWNSTRREWSSVETDEPLMETSRAFAISASENGAAVLASGGLFIFKDDLVTEVEFSEGTVPEGLCYVGEEVAVLFNDGSVAITEGSATELVQIVESSEKTAVGSFSSDQNILVWVNTDGTASRFDVTESLLTDVSLPDSAVCLMISEGQLFAQNGSSLYRLNDEDSWEPQYSGTFTGEDHLYTDMGICTLASEDLVTAGLPQTPEKTCQLDDGTIWAISTGGISVWAEIGSVETRLPEADVQMMRFRMAGQTGGGSGNGSGIGTTDMSMRGVFRIYESVSSRPDPFSEFPLTSRDLRRSLADLTIEELHLVGITLDPTGGDQAMVEDANGVAYVLKEGTVLRNNTHIAEITGNEVIVVQEVTVGSEDAVGGTTLIPTIFSMRLHEEGGL